jgi:hypothetical protein
MNRREFAKNNLMACAGLTVAPALSLIDKGIFDFITEKDIREFLSKILYTRKEVDDYFADEAFPFSKHSEKLGWLLCDAHFRDGMNNSISVYNYAKPDGERLMTNYANQPCRINTYGDSFTQCHQVSDNETWQESMAAHLQEPVRNFGIGGYSVYQAYLRMLIEEKRTPAEYIIFNIYSDDHYRNLDSWRNVRMHKKNNFIKPPLPHVKVDLKNRTMVEYPNPTPRKEDFYKLCDLDQTYKLFKDDFVAKVMIAHNKTKEQNENLAYKDIQALTQTHGIETSIDTNLTMSKVISAYHTDCAIFSTIKIIDKIEKFAKENNKKILFVMSYPPWEIVKAHADGKRWDQRVINHIKKKQFPLVDLGQAHLDDFKSFNIEIKNYLKRYYIGHYNPFGNMFCAQEIIKKMIGIMSDKPVPYNENTKIGSI